MIERLITWSAKNPFLIGLATLLLIPSLLSAETWSLDRAVATALETAPELQAVPVRRNPTSGGRWAVSFLSGWSPC